MEKLNVAVLTENCQYAKALARGFCMEDSGILVRVLETSPRNWQELAEWIIVTDMPQAEGADEKQLLFLTKEKKRWPVRQIFAEIKSRFFQIKGFEFCPSDGSETEIIGVFKSGGGCGATSLAIALGRLLALRTEKDALYVNGGQRDGYGIYLDRPPVMRPKKEFLWHVLENRPWEAEPYLFRDDFGLCFFEREKGVNSLYSRHNMEKLLQSISEKRRFSYVVIDEPDRELAQLCHHRLAIYSMRDKRTLVDAFKEGFEEDFIPVYNFAEASEPVENSLPRDDDSFEAGGDGNIDISLEGLMGEGIDKLVSFFVDKKQLQ